jgi:hypothetical protein
MTPERRRQIERLYLVAIEQPPDRRSAWLTDACAGDAGLFREVEALLAQHAAATGTLDSRGPTVATGLVGEMNTTIGSGRRIGGYEILERIGAGGMGEVYRARDARLGRDVAIKILPRAWTSDPDRLARFRREARMLAALNHSNVATIHGVVEGDGLEALVLELVTGETLAERIAQSRDGRVPISEALSIARQIVDALDAAHEKGIVHRDLKPANIKVRPDGTIKVLDFGLAKLSPTEIDNRETGFASWDATQAPTTTNGRTREGLIVGTPAYMSPEQARGQVVDKRTDIWAFGCVLYELLSGQAAFAGETALDTLTAVVQRDPDWGVLPRDVPPGLVDLLRRCLEKDAARRPRDIGEIRSELVQPTGEAFTRPGAAGNAGHAAPAPTSVRRLAIATVGLALIAIAAVFVLRERGSISVEPSRSATPLTYRQLTALDSATQPTVSADQRMIAFIGGPHTSVPETGDPSQVYVKPLPDGDAVQLTRDEQVKFSPRFSPDGTRIVYSTISTSGFDTWVVPVIGGQAPRRLLQNAEGASWIGERLLFSFLTGKGITMAVASATESRSDQRTLFVEDGKMEHFSSLSPDGQRLLLAEMGFGGWESCRLAPVDGSSAGKKVGPQPSQCTSVAWSPDGKWMYFSADAGNGFHIWRQAFPAGQPEQITSGATEEEGSPSARMAVPFSPRSAPGKARCGCTTPRATGASPRTPSRSIQSFHPTRRSCTTSSRPHSERPFPTAPCG